MATVCESIYNQYSLHNCMNDHHSHVKYAQVHLKAAENPDQIYYILRLWSSWRFYTNRVVFFLFFPCKIACDQFLAVQHISAALITEPRLKSSSFCHHFPCLKACSLFSRYCNARGQQDRGDDWLLHSAAGSFDLWLCNHVMENIYWHRNSAGIKRWAELSGGTASHGSSLSLTDILMAHVINLQML